MRLLYCLLFIATIQNSVKYTLNCCNLAILICNPVLFIYYAIGKVIDHLKNYINYCKIPKSVMHRSTSNSFSAVKVVLKILFKN